MTSSTTSITTSGLRPLSIRCRIHERSSALSTSFRPYCLRRSSTTACVNPSGDVLSDCSKSLAGGVAKRRRRSCLSAGVPVLVVVCFALPRMVCTIRRCNESSVRKGTESASTSVVPTCRQRPTCLRLTFAWTITRRSRVPVQMPQHSYLPSPWIHRGSVRHHLDSR
jgi:hypothetical protein